VCLGLDAVKMSIMRQIKLLNDAWAVMGDGEREVVRIFMLREFGHAPDPIQTWAEVLASIKCVQCGPEQSVSGACLACSKHRSEPVDLSLGPDVVVLNTAMRREMLLSILLGRAKRSVYVQLRNQMVFQSSILAERVRVTPKIALKWLRGRRDLVGYVDLLVGAMRLGAGCFVSSVATITHWGRYILLDVLAERDIFSCCHLCASEALSEFKIKARFGVVDVAVDDAELFDWQYVTQMLGRYDHEVFADMDDLETRVDYDGTLPVRNSLHHLKGEFDVRYDALLEEEGARFGFVCANNLAASGGVFQPLCVNALTTVPTGSVGAAGHTRAALAELDKAQLNKKLAIVYMTEGEERAVKFASEHSRSGWLWKLELAKLRNLVPGPLGLYMASARVSAYGESAFLATLPNCPLMWGDDHKIVDTNMFMGWQEVGYVANRDFKNYNICHKHSRMQAFYRSAARVCRERGAEEMARELEYMIKCLDDVGVVMEDGTYFKWEYGLQTGWAHTMLFHCVHNSCAGRVVDDMLSSHVGWKRYIARHQGDDSAEVWNAVMAGPIAQAILDAGGQVGQATKQHFARAPGSWSEFLRVWQRSGMQRASTVRAICSFVSADSQHAAYEGGGSMIKSIVSGANTVWRRAGGKTGWRESDMAVLCAYWASTNAQFRENRVVDWRVHFGTDAPLMFAAYPTQGWGLREVKRDVVARYDVKAGEILQRRARRNLQLGARAQGAEKYAVEYTVDLLECAVERSVELSGAVVGSAKVLPPVSEVVRFVATQAYSAAQAGVPGWRDEDAFAKQMAVGYLFAGSERVGRAYLKDGLRPVVRCSSKVVHVLERGIKLLAGKTRGVISLCASYYVCAEKYWSHVEAVMQRHRVGQLCHKNVGLVIAREAIRRGEWI